MELKNTPKPLHPVLAKIQHINGLGNSEWFEVVLFDGQKWVAYQGSETFQDGEKVLEWWYCSEIAKLRSEMEGK